MGPCKKDDHDEEAEDTHDAGPCGFQTRGRLGAASLDLPVDKESNPEHGKKRFVEPEHGYLTSAEITAPRVFRFANYVRAETDNIGSAGVALRKLATDLLPQAYTLLANLRDLKSRSCHFSPHRPRAVPSVKRINHVPSGGLDPLISPILRAIRNPLGKPAGASPFSHQLFLFF